MKRNTTKLAPAPEIIEAPQRPGRTIPAQWHKDDIYVEGTLQSAIGHMIDGLQNQWRDSGTTVAYFHDVLFKAHALEDLLAVLVAEMEARGARMPEDE